jgi:hypothetical protein
MATINIEGTNKTPTIKSDSSQGVVEIKGRSHPEDTVSFYKPLLNWADEYSKNPVEKTTININLEHFNTSSSKCILDFLNKIEPIQHKNKNVLVNWYYESDDDEMLEAGETYQSITGLPFNMIPY